MTAHCSTLAQDITLCDSVFCPSLNLNPHCTEKSGLIKMNEGTAYFHPVLFFVYVWP